MRQSAAFSLAPGFTAGSQLWTNWVARESEIAQGSWLDEEHDSIRGELFSDAALSGAITVGPISVEPLRGEEGERGWPAAIATFELALARRFGERRYFYNPRLETARSIDGETADLLSLALGIRCESADRGPRRPDRQPFYPVLPGAPPTHPILPDALDRTVDCSQAADLLAIVPTLSWQQSVVLARVARSYASAVWFAEYDPELCFIWLCRAVETAAQDTEVDDPVEVLARDKPDVARLLAAEEPVLRREAGSYARTTGAAQKFRRFLVDRCPDPPPRDAPVEREGRQIVWAERERLVRELYGYRSAALHAGTPIPPALHRPVTSSSHRYEVMLKDLTGYGAIDGHVIMMWVFEYMARTALLDWWAEMGREADARR